MNYVSPSSGEPTGEAQFITELLLSVEAKKKGVALPPKCWTDPKYKRKFIEQITTVHQKLKIFSANSIINAIKSRNLYSLRPGWVYNILVEEEEKLNKTAKAVAESNQIEVSSDVTSVRKSIGEVKSKLEKLR